MMDSLQKQIGVIYVMFIILNHRLKGLFSAAP